MQHHDDAVERYVDAAAEDPANLGVVLIGSVARGDPRDDSDVDVYLVVSPDAFAAAVAGNRVSYVIDDGVDHERSYLDVKVASIECLERAVAAADEPMRASFLGARVVWARDPRIAPLVDALPVLDDGEFERRARSCIAQARLQFFYFLPQAVEQDNPLLVHHAAVHLVFAAGRALLAHNRRLYQGAKYLERAVDGLPSCPPGFTSLMRATVQDPSLDTAGELVTALETFRDWDVGYEETLSTYVLDTELAWYTQSPVPEYR